MPLYEYHCDRCGETFEIIQKFSDEPLTTHEACGGAVERLLSPPALQFKGTGWYVTDYARKSASSPSSGSSDKSGTSSSDSTQSSAKKTESSRSKSDSKS